MQAKAKIGIGALACCFCRALSCTSFHCVQCSQDDSWEIGSEHQLHTFCGVGNERGCHRMELHCHTQGRSDIEAQEQLKEASDVERAHKHTKKVCRAS